MWPRVPRLLDPGRIPGTSRDIKPAVFAALRVAELCTDHMLDSRSMEPTTLVTGLKAAGAAKSLVQGTPGLARRGLRQLRLRGTFEPAWLDLGADEQAADNELTDPQLADVHRFLASAQVPPILTTLALMRLSPSGPEQEHALAVVENIFKNEAAKWNADSKTPWRKQVDSIWRRINLVFDAIPESKLTEQLDNEIEDFSTFVQSPLQMPRFGASNKQYLDELVGLTSDLSLLSATVADAQRLATAIHSIDLQSIITHSHAELDHHADFAHLYISRTFVDTDSNSLVDTEALTLGQALFRVVLMGSPGAGKSTFITHLVKSASDAKITDTPIGAVVLRCRDYRSKGWDLTIPAFMAQQVTIETTHRFSEDDLVHIFLLGRAICVIDGLDEVTDPSQRTEMVKRIHSFISRFPALSVLVTTREVGYDRTPLSRSVFAHVRLGEFSFDEVEEYANRWFGLVNKSELVPRFMMESESVADLRTNPLLLSLLCVLYRDSGAIPADRRGIYSKCAELLFRTWDAHRQISQAGSMPKYADRLMQEVARWFYNTPSTQGGLEENQIARVLAQYMETTLGFSREEAERSSRDFMAFCADRAWLLGAVGTNSYGQRLFRFTHRTFYEFFAAESLARQSETADGICAHIDDAWSRDATSVVPELLVQAYDYSHERGAAKVFQQLCSRRSSNLLLLRLITGTILPAYARKAGFDLVLLRWDHATDGADPIEFHELLAINPQARAQFITDYMRPSSDIDTIATFLEAWSSLQNSGAGAPIRDAWSDEIARILSEVDINAIRERMRSGAFDNWAIGSGYQLPVDRTPLSYLVTSGTYGPTPGIIWWTIESVFGRGNTLPENQTRAKVVSDLHALMLSGEQLSPKIVDRLYAVIAEQGHLFLEWHKASKLGREEEQLRDILAVVVAACFEKDPAAIELIIATDPAWTHPVSSVATVRQKKLGGRKQPERAEVEAAKECLAELPAIFREWTVGRRNLVASTG